MSWRFVDDLSGSDRGFEAEGADLRELLASAADATLAVMVDDPRLVRPSVRVPVRIEGKDPGELLFGLLQELIYRKDADGLLLRLGDARIARGDGSWSLDGELLGEPLDLGRHEPGTDVKAVTLHRFAVGQRDGRWRAVVVLDV